MIPVSLNKFLTYTVHIRVDMRGSDAWSSQGCIAPACSDRWAQAMLSGI